MAGTFEDMREDVRDALEAVRGPRRRLVYEVVADNRNCSTRREARRAMRGQLRKLGFDPTIVFLLLQLAVAIWKLMREMGWLDEATPETVAAEVEAMVDDD